MSKQGVAARLFLSPEQLALAKTLYATALRDAMIIGAIGGGIYLLWSDFLLRRQIDDVIDAIPVHLGCGTWAVVATGWCPSFPAFLLFSILSPAVYDLIS